MMPIPRRFPGVPFVAHIAFAVPFARVAVYVMDKAAHLHSLVGRLV